MNMLDLNFNSIKVKETKHICKMIIRSNLCYFKVEEIKSRIKIR